MRFFISKFALSVLLFLGLFFLAENSFANSDLAVSKVKDNCDIRDSIEGYHCLGYLVEQGFNQQNFAKEQIEFDPVTPGDVFVIKLTKPLVFQGAQDTDCDGDHPLCGDGIAFTMHGHGASQSIVLDTTEIQDDRCAIRIKAPQDLYMIFTDFKIRTKQTNLFERVEDGASADAVICTEGGDKIIIQDVSLETDASQGAVCGNGIKEQGEACDQGEENGVPGSGCNTLCGTVNEPEDTPNNCLEGPDYDGDGEVDGIQQVCDFDVDQDNIPDGVDNCSVRKVKPGTGGKTYYRSIVEDTSLTEDEKKATLLSFANNDQLDTDEDGNGDHCDDDIDSDGKWNNQDGDQFPNASPQDGEDNCPFIANPNQEDGNQNGVGDVCDSDQANDTDGDGVENDVDNCVDVSNAGQENLDNDELGDACDDDIDGDGLPNEVELADMLCLDPNVVDSDSDGLSDGPGEDGTQEADPCPCVPDLECTDPDIDDVDHDGVSNNPDNCPNIANGDQIDSDGDGIGDMCDPDIPDGDADEDGVLNKDDNCKIVANEDQLDTDSDGIGDLCDPNPNVGTGEDIDPGISSEDTGSGCFNSLQPTKQNDALPWLSLAGLALAVHFGRKVRKN